MFSPTEKLACFKIWVVFGSYFPVNMFLIKYLPQGLFHSEDANSNKIISRCYHAAVLGLRDPGGRGTGTLGISGWGCAAGTLEPLVSTRTGSAEFCYPILE